MATLIPERTVETQQFQNKNNVQLPVQKVLLLSRQRVSTRVEVYSFVVQCKGLTDEQVNRHHSDLYGGDLL